MYKKVFLHFLILFGSVAVTVAQSALQKADSVLKSMNQDEKIGQLFMVPIYAGSDKKYLEEIEDAVKIHRVGGIILMDGSISKVTNITRYLRSNSTVPAFVSIDANPGLGKKIDSAFVFPADLMLGAMRSDTLIYTMATEVARQMTLLGINLNFGPSGDLINPEEINDPGDSFGSNKQNVAGKAVAFMRGLQDNGIMACAKRFPVQGITILDIKKNQLPTLSAYVDSTTIYPYRQLFENGIKGVLPASSEFPLFYEKKKNLRRNKYSPALLSSIYAGHWLKKELNYNGLVFVSVPDIQDRTGKNKMGDAEVLAFQAGNDIILFPEDLASAIRKIKKLIKKESRFEQQLDATVRKILIAKFDNGLFTPPALPTENLYDQLNTFECKILNKQLIEKAVTVARNKADILPFKNIDVKKILSISIGLTAHNTFTRYLSKYTTVQHVTEDQPKLSELTVQADVIIVGIFKALDKKDLQLIRQLQQVQAEKEIIICSFYAPAQLQQLDKFNTLIQAYEVSDEILKTTAQMVFGAKPIKGKLPLAISPLLKEGMGDVIPAIKRFQFATPEEAGLDSKTLAKIEAVANEAIDIKATPGCYVLVAKGGKVVYEKSFGYQSYDKLIPVTDTTVYDLASITKVSATLQAAMFMYDRGLIDINKKASYYLPELKNSNKKDLILKDILTHQAGLWPFLPFWTQTLKDSVFRPEFYSKKVSKEYPYQVAPQLYAAASMPDSLWQWIIKAKIRDKIARTPYDYRYSDMGFYIMQHLAEKVLNQPLQDFLNQNLYDPLGAVTTGYLPLTRFPANQIAPTENDKLFRHAYLVGTVHDQGAAMQGGVAGHAGLFSDALDLAKLGQMLLQKGTYGGTQYYKPETVTLFTSQQFATSRRGLGWDRPVQSDWNSPTSRYASQQTFGHTGFTGTCIWVDPEFDLVYVFLSNRVNPSMTNNKLLSASIRSRIQDIVYESIFSYCGNPILLEPVVQFSKIP